MSAGPRTPRSLGLPLALLGLLLGGPGCRPLTPELPGCTEGEAQCEPEVPSSVSAATLSPALPADASQAPVSGRYLSASVSIRNPEGARELELLCHNRRLATWGLSATGDTATVGAVIDLLPCWSGGEPTGPSEPFGVTLVVVDRLGARHVQEVGFLRLDPRREEGLSLSGPDATGRWAFLSLSTRHTDGSFLLTSDQDLSRPPEVFVDGLPATVVRLPTGWKIRLPSSVYGLDATGALRDGNAFTVSLEVRATNLVGLVTTLQGGLQLQLELLPAVPVAFPTNGSTAQATSPLASPEGLMGLGELPANGSAHQILVRPDGSVQQRSFQLDPYGMASCGSPFSTGSSGFCPLAINARGQLLVRDAFVGKLLLQRLPLPTGGTGVLTDADWITLDDPSPWSLPVDWARVGTQHVCTEGRTSQRLCPADCATPLRAPRVCIASDGTITSESPTGPAELSAGDSSIKAGLGEFFVTHYHHPDQVDDTTRRPGPAVGIGTPGGPQLWVGSDDLAGGTPDTWLDAGLGVALLTNIPPILVTRTGETQAYWYPQWRPWGPSPFADRYPASIDAEGRVTTIEVNPEGLAVLSRWAPSVSEPDAVQSFSLGRWNLGVSTTPPALARPLQGGGSVMVLDVLDDLGSGQYWLVLAVDDRLRPLWSRVFEGSVPPLLLPSPDGSMVWVVEQDSTESVVHFLPNRP